MSRPTEYKWDNPIVAREDPPAQQPALRHALDYIQRLPKALRDFAAVLEGAIDGAVTASSALLNDRINAIAPLVPLVYGSALADGAGGFSHRHCAGPLGILSGAASGVTLSTTAIRIDLAAQGLALAGDPFRAALLVSGLNDNTDWFSSERNVGADTRTATLFFMQTRNAANLLIDPSGGFGPVGVNFVLFGEAT